MLLMVEIGRVDICPIFHMQGSPKDAWPGLDNLWLPSGTVESHPLLTGLMSAIPCLGS